MDQERADRVTIRPALLADVVDIRAIYRLSSLSNEGDRTLLTEHPELLEWPDAALQQGRTRVATAGRRIIGFATLASGEENGELEDLFVDPGWMRRGVGNSLIEDAARVARAKGWSCIEVDANPDALAFYERVGFAAIGEAVLEYGTGVRMRLEIGSA